MSKNIASCLALLLLFTSFACAAQKSDKIVIDKPIMFDTTAADAIFEKHEILPANDPWRANVENWPVHPNSAGMLNDVGLDKPLRMNADMNFILIPPNQPKVPVKLLVYPDESDKGPFPVPENTPIEGWPGFLTGYEGKVFATQEERAKAFADYQANVENSNADRHAVVLDLATMTEYDFYQMAKRPSGWECSNAAVFDILKGNTRPKGWTSSDASGMQIFPSIPRYDEFKKGEINHALRFTTRKTRRAYVFPASHHAGHTTDENAPRMGERFRLKADFDTSGFSREVQIVLKALKKHGMILADNGIEMAVSISPDERIPAMHDELRRVKTSDFEVIEAPK